MAAFFRPHLTLSAVAPWIAPVGGAIAGGAVAALFLLVPGGTLEDWVWRSGVAALVPVAQPPLGTTARMVLALGTGCVAAAVSWSALFLLFGVGGVFGRKDTPGEAGAPVLRRADAHPDAPSRRPLSAADLGAPLPPPTPASAEVVDATPAAVVAEALTQAVEILPAPLATSPSPPVPPVERALPADLDQPLAAFHPEAVPDAPREPIRPVAPLRTPVALGQGERIATVELPVRPETNEPPSIEALLRRLEQGARRQARA
ncbi:hypothetical protein ACU5AX_06225 [Sphingomonas sp. XXL09]|uniref:hypothetical protein n=1 Tax=Sphingomonas sp. XXL09 TaxID=3457787 RepID=UPI00406BCD89